MKNCRNKYNARPVELDNLRFDSTAEGRRYSELKLLQRAGEIKGLWVHPKFRIHVNGELICTYEADFAYIDKAGERVVEDVKSKPTKTAVYRLKKRLLKAVHGIEITEIGV